MSTEKFRPSLTLPEINYLISLTESAPQSDPVNISVRSKLIPLALKAKHGITKAAYVTTPALSLEERLGMTESASDKRKRAYEKFQTHPHLLTAEEIYLVKAYRYEEGLMTEEEEREFEK